MHSTGVERWLARVTMARSDDPDDPETGPIVHLTDDELARLTVGVDGASEATSSTSRKRRKKGHRVGEPYELTSGPPGSRAEKQTLYWAARAVREAIGYKAGTYDGTATIEGLRAILTDRLDRLMTRQGIPDDGARLAPREDGDRDSVRALFPKAIVVPSTWHSHMTSEQGRGESRSRRADLVSLSLLAYIVYAYRKPGRFDGDLLWMNQEIIRDRMQISRRDYDNALRDLNREGFISRVVVWGRVPWDGRTVGAYRFAIPRLPKLTPVTKHRKRGLKAP